MDDKLNSGATGVPSPALPGFGAPDGNTPEKKTSKILTLAKSRKVKYILTTVIAATTLLILTVAAFLIYMAVIESQNNTVPLFSDNLLPARYNGGNGEKWGFINKNGDTVINYQFDSAEPFAKNGLALVEYDGKFGYINKQGYYEIMPEFVYAESFDANGNPAVVKTADNMFHFTNADGNFIKNEMNSEYENVKPFNADGVAFVTTDKSLWFPIDLSGKKLSDNSFNVVGDYSEGFACVAKDGKFGYITTKFDLAVELKYDAALDFSCGLAAVCLDSKWGYINASGELVIPCQFDFAGGFASNGLAAVTHDGKFGYIDKDGVYVIRAMFTGAEKFDVNGLARVFDGSLWGYIDATGEYKIYPQFTEAYNFENGLARVEFNLYGDSVYGFIDAQGDRVIVGEFDNVSDFYRDGFAVACVNEKYGIINKKGYYVINPTFSMIYGIPELPDSVEPMPE